ncbi:Crp/Fnr family transcriptional regulator [Chroococcidiopsis sp. CCMEE 29]|uniref:Crp/Fnr family transcriptional regulator n=1 Tax=Chroococcidiopsis sp. CCMEE 29 TaxID=155894 RepID=UPI002022318D|nr:Crp/Fnr family transcriptional regulator [Chroococcidiopsis sp. CCMEE 29]
MTVLLANHQQRTFSRRDLIPLQPELLWRIETGVVRTLTWSEEGTPVTLGYWGATDVVGQPLSRVTPYQIECITTVEASLVPEHLWHQVLEAVLKHAQQTEELLCIFHQEPLHLRLRLLLVWLAQKFGRQVETGKLIDLRLTHQQLAEVIGATRVTVTRLLKQFEREGIIKRSHRQPLILCK